MIGSSSRLLAAASALIVAATVAAFAQSATGPAEDGRQGGMAACRADIQALCSGVPTGGRAKLQCLVENRAKASPECQAVMSSLQQRASRKIERKAQAQACASDVASLCAGAKGRERSECLKANEAKLSPACTGVRQQAKEQRRVATKQARQACKVDADALCGAVEKGARMQCLRDNAAKVSAGCNEALARLPMRKRDRQAGNGGAPPLEAPKPQ